MGAQATIERVKAAPAFAVPMGEPVMVAARWALKEAYGVAPSEVGSGGSIPLLSTMSKAVPGAEFTSWRAEDIAGSRIRRGNESVDADPRASSQPRRA